MAGTYTEITELVVQESAVYGAVVPVKVTIKNTYPGAYIYIFARGIVDSNVLNFGTTAYAVASGDVKSFNTSFIAPSTGNYVVVEVHSMYLGIDEAWHDDDMLKKLVVLEGVPLSGSIISKWVNKAPEGSKLSMPAMVAADGNTFEIGVQWRNTGTVNYDARIELVTRYPDGSIAKSEVSTYYGMTAGESHSKEFNVVAVVVGKEGPWTTTIKLVARSGEVLDTWSGTCLQVGTAISGEIVTVWLNKAPEGSRLGIPAAVAADGNSFEVGAQYKNTSGRSMYGGAEVKVWDPDGLLRASPPVDWAYMSAGKVLSVEYNIVAVDKAGIWTITIRFLGYLSDREDATELDRFPESGKATCLDAGAIVPPGGIWDLVIDSYKKTAAAQVVTVSPGDTLEVTASFLYTTDVVANVELWVSLYIAPGRDYTVGSTIQLEPGREKKWTGTVHMPITDAVGLKNYTYDLLVELPDHGLQAWAKGAITVTNMPQAFLGNLGQMIGMLVLVMMMGIVMDIMTGPEGMLPTAKKYVEKAEKVVTPVVGLFAKRKE